MTHPPKPTATELDLLRVLWRVGPATAKQVHLAAEQEREISAATVLRLLQVMHAKGILLRDDSQKSHVYRPAQEQASLQTGMLGDLIRKAFAGSGKAMILAALKGGHVTSEERKEIEAFLKDEGVEP